MNWSKITDILLIAIGAFFVYLAIDGIYLIARYLQGDTNIGDFLFWMPIGTSVTGMIGTLCLFMVYRRKKKRMVNIKK